MSEAQTILDAIYTQISGYSGLSYVEKFYKNEDEEDAIIKARFPFVNMQILKLNTENIDTRNPRNMLRHRYGFMITFGVRNKSKPLTLEGDATTNGIWDLSEDIDAAISSDMTFSGSVDGTVEVYETETGVVKDIDGKFWIGGGVSAKQVYKDIYVKRSNKY